MPLTLESLNADLNAMLCDMPQGVTIRRVGKQPQTLAAAVSDTGASSASIRAGAAGIDVVDSVAVTVRLGDCLWRPAIGDALTVDGVVPTQSGRVVPTRYRITSVRQIPADAALELIAEVM